MEGLKTIGEITDDPMKNLFKAYITASDAKCIKYTKTKNDRYNNNKYIASKNQMISALKNMRS